MTRKLLARTLVLLSSLLAILPAAAEILFTAPPRETPEDAAKIYGPVADYLTEAIGEKVTYRHLSSWGLYQATMPKNQYDLVFDGPHFVAWRVSQLQHEPLARLSGLLTFVVITKQDNPDYTDINTLKGHAVCGLAPPNLATLTLLEQFGPAQQPLLIQTQSFREAYQGVIDGKCIAAVLRDKMYHKLEGDTGRTRVIFESSGFPNQAFTASANLSDAQKVRIISALLAPEAATRISGFLNKYSHGKGMVRATRAEYRGMEKPLQDMWGFELGRSGG